MVEREPRIAVVGSRHPGAEGIAAVEAISSLLVSKGSVLVSGAAIGTDMIAHRTAIEEGVATIACLPQGLETINWPYWRKEFVEVADDDLLLLSPYHRGQPINRQTPVRRNRLIAALSGAVVAGEARMYSGTWHCVRAALDFHLPVFFLKLSDACRDESLASLYRWLESKGARGFTLDEALCPEFALDIFQTAIQSLAQRRADKPPDLFE